MIASIRGILAQEGRDSVIIETAGGLGYEVAVSGRTLSHLPSLGQEVKLATHLVVREDAVSLFGFETAEEKAMFLKLIGVTGVGPKVAMALLSGMSTAELAVALVAGDARAIARTPGIGKKIAERIILELREKVDTQELNAAAVDLPAGAAGGMTQEAIKALMALGYSSVEASRAVSKAGPAASVEEIIVLALRGLDTGR